MKKTRARSSFFIRHSTFVLLAFVVTSARANDLTVDRHTITMSDSVTIVVSLENAFSSVDAVNVPVKNLAIDGQPSISSEFSWINGTSVRRKIFRFSARPLSPGPALVGPLVVNGDDGQRDTLGPVALQVMPDLASSSNDPLTILHALDTAGREPFFVITDTDKTAAYVGEEIIVTWYLYNAAPVQRWGPARVPKLEDFWVEEINVRNEPSEQVIVGTLPMQKVPIRRVALFPLRSGKLTIGPTEADAEILRRVDSPFGVFEGSLVEVRYSSAPVSVEVRPLPAGAAGDLVGDVDLECKVPQQRGGGPVVMHVILSGHANLRSAPPPKFAGSVDGDVEVQPVSVELVKTRDGATMTRMWRILIFPSRAGSLHIPALTTDVFQPANAQRVHLQCTDMTLDVTTAARPMSSPAAPARRKFDLRPYLPHLGALALLVIAATIIVPRVRRARRIDALVRDIVRDASPHDIRSRVETLLAQRGINETALQHEASDRGEAYRAVMSLLDALEHDRVLAHEAADDVEVRVRDLVQSL